MLTRLHARYGKTLSDDLRFRAAAPIVGGHEFMQDGQGGLEEGARPSSQNNFQGRYVIRHAWTGPIPCKYPRRKIWVGPPPEIAQQAGFQDPGIKPALGLAFAPRGEIQLAQVVRQNIPELGIIAGASAANPLASGSASSGAPPSSAAPPADRPAPRTRSGCGCATSDPRDALGGAVMLGVGLLVAWRRRPTCSNRPLALRARGCRRFETPPTAPPQDIFGDPHHHR